MALLTNPQLRKLLLDHFTTELEKARDHTADTVDGTQLRQYQGEARVYKKLVKLVT